MDTKASTNFWWLKKNKTEIEPTKTDDNDLLASSTPVNEDEISSSLADFLEKEKRIEHGAGGDQGDVDIGSLIEEINRLAAQSPLGPYEKGAGDRSIEDIMREAEKIYMESSKSFEQLSQHSKTSQNISDFLHSQSSNSTPTPKSVSPLPIDSDREKEDKKDHIQNVDSDEYSEDFTDDNKSEVQDPSYIVIDNAEINKTYVNNVESEIPLTSHESPKLHQSSNEIADNINLEHLEVAENVDIVNNVDDNSNTLKYLENNHKIDEEIVSEILPRDQAPPSQDDELQKKLEEIQYFKGEILRKDEVIQILIEENKSLKGDIKELQNQLQETIELLEQAKNALKAQSLKSPEINLELDKALEEVKDIKEQNTALQLQLDNVNKSHQLLKLSHEELLTTNKNLERRVVDVDAALSKYKTELLNTQQHRDKLQENEVNLSKLLEIEKLQVKSLKLQTEKDARCIMDLNRQIKEMERIIARKHPDSVSALIVAAKNDVSETNLSARKFLEDRIKALEQEAQKRDVQNSKVFLDVQEKFNQMKVKYESHIEDLELHVNDLKVQLKHRSDTYDVYTQTIQDQHVPQKETVNIGMQTETAAVKSQMQRIGTTKRLEKLIDNKEETHLLATIRGLQTDLANKEKVAAKLQREVDELKRTNRRLQKEREGSLRNLSERKEFRSYPDKLALQIRPESRVDSDEKSLEDELRAIKSERDKMKLQLCRIEEDYQDLKAKRLQDLHTLQDAHEREISTYLTNITPLREQLEVQQVSLSSLQKQLSAVKEELAVVTVERDHLNSRLQCTSAIVPYDHSPNGADSEVVALHKKISYLEKRYEEREHRLRAIVHGLAQKNITNMTCEQCAARQQQLVGYKAELDQLIATLKCLQ